jgi:hypothetical protein
VPACAWPTDKRKRFEFLQREIRNDRRYRLRHRRPIGADKQILVQAFAKGQNQGLVNALQKMKAVGHLEITGTLGTDCSYIKIVPTATGRKILFVTNRWIRFGEAYYDTQSQSFNLTAGMFELNDQDKSKSTGVLYPAAQLVMDQQGELQWDLRQNAWRLVDVIDWKGTQGVN